MAQGSVLALGNFDAVHRGHQAVIHTAHAKAATLGAPAAVMTFEPHPRYFFSSSKQPIRLVPFHHKARLLQAHGVDVLFVMGFNEAFSQISAEAFIKDILVKQLQVRHVVTGEDFIFGYKRGGNADMLEAYANETEAFGFSRVVPVGGREHIFSSSLVRSFVQAGQMRKAADILGRPYEMIGRVQHGDKLGRTIGFPTANIIPPAITLPAKGVYAVRVAIYDEMDIQAEPHWYDGVANFGQRPTFAGTRMQLEAHLFDVEKDLYDKRLRVQFVRHVRDEKPFDGVDALKAQIARDCETARAYLAMENR